MKQGEIDASLPDSNNQSVFVGHTPTLNTPILTQGNSSILIGDQRYNDTLMTTGAVSVGIGQTVKPTGAGAIAIGENSTASDASSIATGVSATATSADAVALGKSATAQGSGALAVGNRTLADGVQAVAIGAGGNAGVGRITAIANNALYVGSASGDNTAQASGANSIAIGLDVNAQSAQDIGIGYNSFASGGDSIALGTRAKAEGATGVAIGVDAWAQKDSSVAIGQGSLATDPYVVSVGSGNGGDAYGTRRITNVADPQNPSDAATKSYVDSRVDGTNSQFKKMNKRIDNVGAMQASLITATTQMQALPEGKKTAIGVGVGAYGASKAGTVGIIHRLPGNFQLMANGSIATGGEKAGGIGFGYVF